MPEPKEAAYEPGQHPMPPGIVAPDGSRTGRRAQSADYE